MGETTADQVPDGSASLGPAALARLAGDAGLGEEKRVSAAEALSFRDGHREAGAALLAPLADDTSLPGHTRVDAAAATARVVGHAEDGAARLARLADDSAGKWPKRRRLLRKWLWLEKFVDDLDHLNAVEALSALERHQEAAAALLTRCAQDASLHAHLRRSAAATLAGMAEHRENGAALLARLARDPALGHGRSEASGTITRMTSDPQPPAGTRTHIRLLAGHAGAGRPVFEVLPARPVQSDLFQLAGSPGMVLGCAAGDVLRVADDGQFEVVEQGDNWCIQAAGLGRLRPGSFVALREAAAVLPGMAEAPADLRFIVVTVSRTVGLPAIERVMDTWAAGIDGVEWWLGNGDHPAASA